MPQIWGAHKSAYCKFCPVPPRKVLPVKKRVTSDHHIQTYTELYIRHPHAQLKVNQFQEEVGEPEPLTPICECVLAEDVNTCPKCAPPKKKERPKECKCHPGIELAEEQYNMKKLYRAAKRLARKLKKAKPDLELWFEKMERKIDREIAKKLAAYKEAIQHIGQVIDTVEKKKEKLKLSVKGPPWFMQLSCQQIILVEHLSRAVRFDIEDDHYEKSFYVLRQLGFYPNPQIRHIRTSLRECHYNTIEFLNKLLELESPYDKFGERQAGSPYTFNEILIMNSICHLMLPTFLQELIERLPPFQQPDNLPQRMEYPKLGRKTRKQYNSPYEEPVWIDQIDWKDVMVVEERNRYVEYLETTKRTIPPLALVRRPSLIDSRPSYAEQVQKILNASHRIEKPECKRVNKKRRRRRKRPIVFDSKQDMTAVAKEELSSDNEDKCVFLRWPETPLETIFVGHMEDEDETEEDVISRQTVEDTYVKKYNMDANWVEEGGVQLSMELFGEGDFPEEDDETGRYHLKTPCCPSADIPCPVPYTSPSQVLARPNYVQAKRALDIMRRETCIFDDRDPDTVTIASPFVPAEEKFESAEDTLKNAALRLKAYLHPSKPKRKHRKRKKRSKLKDSERPRFVPTCRLSTGESQSDQLKINSMHQRYAVDSKTKKNSRNSAERKGIKTRNSSKESKNIKNFENVKLNKCGRKRKRRHHKRFREIELERKYSKSTIPVTTLRDDETETDLELEPEAEESQEFMVKLKNQILEEQKEPVLPEPEKPFKGDVKRLLTRVFGDLAEEGFLIAGYPKMDEHPVVQHLISYLKGERMTTSKKKALLEASEKIWQAGFENKFKLIMGSFKSFVSKQRLENINFCDKKWLKNIADGIIEEFSYDVFNTRNKDGRNFYLSSLPQYAPDQRFIRQFYAYFPYKFPESLYIGHDNS